MTGPLCWGGMDVQKPPGHRPNVRQSVHTYWKRALSFIGICHLCVCAFAHMCVLSNWADDSQQESEPHKAAQTGGGEVCT